MQSIDYNIFTIPEITTTIFEKLDLKKDIITILLVCKIWQSHTIEIVQQEFIFKPKKELETKMGLFLSLTGKTFEDYCPVFQNAARDLKDYKLNKELFKKLDNLTEKHEVSFARCFIIDTTSYVNYLASLEQNPVANSSSIATMKERKEAIAGKAFVSLTFKTVDTDDGILYTWDVWKCGQIEFFPIELFNLKLGKKEEESYDLIGEKDKGNYCFYLNKKLIELIIIPQKHPFYKHSKLSAENGRFELPVTRIPSANKYYVPHLDGKNAITSQVLFEEQ